MGSLLNGTPTVRDVHECRGKAHNAFNVNFAFLCRELSLDLVGDPWGRDDRNFQSVLP